MRARAAPSLCILAFALIALGTANELTSQVDDLTEELTVLVVEAPVEDEIASEALDALPILAMHLEIRVTDEGAYWCSPRPPGVDVDSACFKSTLAWLTSSNESDRVRESSRLRLSRLALPIA